MPDISMCQNNECPSKHKCYRHADSGTIPSDRRQSYMEFPLRPDAKHCDYYIPLGENDK